MWSSWFAAALGQGSCWPHHRISSDISFFTAKEQICNGETRMGDTQKGLGFWGNGRRNNSMRHPKAQGLQTAKQKVGEGGRYTWATKGLRGSSGLCPLRQHECQGMARTGKYLGARRVRAPVAHQPLSHILCALKTMADLRRAVLVERTPKNTLKLCLESKAPRPPPKAALGPHEAAAAQRAPGKDLGWRERAPGESLCPGEPMSR